VPYDETLRTKFSMLNTIKIQMFNSFHFGFWPVTLFSSSSFAGKME